MACEKEASLNATPFYRQSPLTRATRRNVETEGSDGDFILCYKSLKANSPNYHGKRGRFQLSFLGTVLLRTTPNSAACYPVGPNGISDTIIRSCQSVQNQTWSVCFASPWDFRHEIGTSTGHWDFGHGATGISDTEPLGFEAPEERDLRHDCPPINWDLRHRFSGNSAIPFANSPSNSDLKLFIKRTTSGCSRFFMEPKK